MITDTGRGHIHALLLIYGVPLSVYVLGLVVLAVAVMFWSIRRSQRRILGNTEAILTLMRSQTTFYDEAVEALTAVDVAVAAGVARDELLAA